MDDSSAFTFPLARLKAEELIQLRANIIDPVPDGIVEHDMARASRALNELATEFARRGM